MINFYLQILSKANETFGTTGVLFALWGTVAVLFGAGLRLGEALALRTPWRRQHVMLGEHQTQVILQGEITSATLHFTTDANAVNKHEWHSAEAVLDVTFGTTMVAAMPPEAKICFFTATTSEGYTVSSTVVFRN